MAITQENYLQHLDELTDEQITQFLDNDPVYSKDAASYRNKRGTEEAAHLPADYYSDRRIAEFLRSF